MHRVLWLAMLSFSRFQLYGGVAPRVNAGKTAHLGQANYEAWGKVNSNKSRGGGDLRFPWMWGRLLYLIAELHMTFGFDALEPPGENLPLRK